MAQRATAALLSLHVSIKYLAKVVSSSPTPDGGITLKLSNGEQLDADMYIPAFGLSPNSSYIPSKFLDDKGFVEVDMNLRVKGAEDVWAIGDVSALEWNQYLAGRAQAIYLSKNFGSALKRKVPAPYKISTRMYSYLFSQDTRGP
jgi:NADH dehydrogenase FAD-containing subunit